MFNEIMAAIGLGSQIGGSIYDRWANKDEARDVEARNRHWSMRAIQDRVRDAEKAGIHPLYALGANTTTPQAEAVMSDTGQQIGGAIERYADSVNRQQSKLEELALRAQIAKTQAETDLIKQEQLKLVMGTPQGGGIPTMGLGLKVDKGEGRVIEGQNSGVYELVAPERPTTSSPGVESGLIPFMGQYQLPGSGLAMLLPTSDDGTGELLQDIPLWMWPSIWAANKRHFGEQHMENLWKEINPLAGTRIFKKSAIEKAKKFKSFIRGLQERRSHQFGNQNVK